MCLARCVAFSAFSAVPALWYRQLLATAHYASLVLYIFFAGGLPRQFVSPMIGC